YVEVDGGVGVPDAELMQDDVAPPRGLHVDAQYLEHVRVRLEAVDLAEIPCALERDQADVRADVEEEPAEAVARDKPDETGEVRLVHAVDHPLRGDEVVPAQVDGGSVLRHPAPDAASDAPGGDPSRAHPVHRAHRVSGQGLRAGHYGNNR